MIGTENWRPQSRAGGVALAVFSLLATAVMADTPTTGPDTEKRFPPLKVPDGFRATLFACDPLVEYPSVIALGPSAGSLLVAYDYMTGLGIEIVRRDQVRVVRDSNGDGYADTTTVYADGFNSIQGLAFHDGAVYVMHAPFLTKLRDRDGDDVAEERIELLSGLGLPPEENSNRLHCANGVVVGHDGWLYLALGDRGCDVRRPEGDRLLVQEGSILRCRSDGRDLHVFSHGLRNIYDVALDEELNVFVRDNENDGGDYMIRVCHCFHGSDHGYPYLYRDRPTEAMPPLADLGRGSSAGGVAYLETAFPAEYRDSLYFCEWGRAVVRYPKQASQSGFAPMHEIDFAVGAPDDPYGFKPTDLVVDRDGSLLISDWCDGQRPKRGRARIYRVTSLASKDQVNNSLLNFAAAAEFHELVNGLNSNRYHVRVAAQLAIENHGRDGAQSLLQALRSGQVDVLGRLHTVWILAHQLGDQAIDVLFEMAEHDLETRVRVQAIRAITDLSDPILASHRIDAGRGDEQMCRRLARLANQAEPRIQLEVIVAQGRLRWSEAPAWMGPHCNLSDPALMHAAMIMLRRCGNWSGALDLLDEPAEVELPNRATLRTLALRALATQATPQIADGLHKRLQRESDPQRRCEYIDLLARIYKQPAEWDYWGFRPGPRPANTIAWEKSQAIETALGNSLSDPDLDVRVNTVRHMLREEIPIPLDSLASWLRDQTRPEGVAAILDALNARPVAEVRGVLEGIIRNRSLLAEHRLRALAKFVADLDELSGQRLIEIGAGLEDGPVLAEVLREFGRQPKLHATAASSLITRLDSRDADVRAAAAESLVSLESTDAAPHVIRLMRDSDIRVRRAAANLCGKLNVRDGADLLLAMASESDLPMRSASLESLRKLTDSRALPIALEALRFEEAQIAALSYLADLGDPQQLEPVASLGNKSRSTEVLTAVVRTFASWQRKISSASEHWHRIERAISVLQGNNGVVLRWQVCGPMDSTTAEKNLSKLVPTRPTQAESILGEQWQVKLAEGIDASVRLSSIESKSSDRVWLATADIELAESQEVEFLASASGKLAAWLNGNSIFTRDTVAAYKVDSDRFDATLSKGINRLAVRIDGDGDETKYQMRFRRKSSQADHERLTQLVLAGRGNVQRGQELFLNTEKSLCGKCHRISEQGSRIGPDLTAIGNRFSRVHLVESILEPSRTVAPSYETWLLLLDTGQVLTGVKLSESATHITLSDNQGKTHEVAKLTIEESRIQPTSIMPDDVYRRLTNTEFVDLVEFLMSLTKTPAK